MMTQEEFMDVLAMRRQGMTYTEIADETGYHPTTIAKWVREGGPPAGRIVGDEDRVIDEKWSARLLELLAGNKDLLATSLFEIVTAEGFAGSYPTVSRWVRSVRGPRFRRADQASVLIETGPGEEGQFDFADCSAWAQRVGLAPVLWCFGMILSWSRWRLWWFTTSTDRHHTFEGTVRFFEAIGGVPKISRTDRMGALGRSQGRRFELYPPALEFALHHGTEIRACQAGDAKRKGKVERPFRVLGESFLEELIVTGLPDDIDEMNRQARVWIDERAHSRIHRTTGVTPTERFATEHGFLGSLPARRFDTDYVETRRVHQVLPFIEWDTVRYSVPADCLGQLVEVRRRVDADQLTIAWAGRTVATHRIADAGTAEVWDPTHRAQAETAALNSTRPRRIQPVTSRAVVTTPPGRLVLPGGDYDVAAPDLTRYTRNGDST